MRAIVIRWAVRALALLTLVVASYLLAAWVGSSLSRNPDWREPERGGVMIGVETNGVHTALVMPLVTPAKDWRREFALSDVARPDRPYTHVSVSWGEREVFLDTPTWWDLSPMVVLRVLTVGGESLEHVVFYVRPQATETLRPFRLTDAQYARLVASIEARLPRERPLIKHPGYGASDVFYDVEGRYTAVNTCNQWTSNRLADAGVRIGRWTPLAGGVMKWATTPLRPEILNGTPEPQPMSAAGTT
jgi:uncharacterized protein (TIGR02117 family)